MDEDQARKQLEQLGLSNKEARVFVSTLFLGEASVQEIANKAGVQRVTAYVVLEALLLMGLVTQSTRGKIITFSPDNPLNLERLLVQKRDQLALQEYTLRSLLPQLSGMLSREKLPTVTKYYEGSRETSAMLEHFSARRFVAGEVWVAGEYIIVSVGSREPLIGITLHNPHLAQLIRHRATES